MLKTVDFNDDAHKYIAQLEEENRRLQGVMRLYENQRAEMIQKIDTLSKDAELGKALRVILKEVGK